MNDTDTSAMLNMLMRIDRETARAYSDGLANIGDREDAERLKDYRLQHAKHADAIFDMLTSMGRDIEDLTPELAGFMTTYQEAVRQTGHEDDTLMALYLTEKATNMAYAQALKNDVSSQVRELLTRHLEHEHEHLTFITEALKEKIDAGTAIKVGV